MLTDDRRRTKSDDNSSPKNPAGITLQDVCQYEGEKTAGIKLQDVCQYKDNKKPKNKVKHIHVHVYFRH